MITASPRTRHRLKFRAETFQAILADAFGLTTDQARADFLGITQSQYTKVRNGFHQPGEVFIAATLGNLPHVPFERLFEIVEVKIHEVES